jgi:hypothetical protein
MRTGKRIWAVRKLIQSRIWAVAGLRPLLVILSAKLPDEIQRGIRCLASLVCGLG